MFRLLLQGPLLTFLTAHAWPLRFLSASPQEGEESMHPCHLISVVLLMGQETGGRDTAADHVSVSFCLSDEGAVRAFLREDCFVRKGRSEVRIPSSFYNPAGASSWLCSSYMLEELKLTVGDANTLHHKSILPCEPVK